MATTFDDSEVAPLDKFYVNTYDVDDPKIDLDKWTLKVRWRRAEARRVFPDQNSGVAQVLPQNTRHVCVEGWDVIGRFGGARLSDFLTMVGADTSARFLYVECADDYYESLDMATALHPQSLLCYEMYDQPLTPRTRRAAAFADSHQDWLQAGQVLDQPFASLTFCKVLATGKIRAIRSSTDSNMATRAITIENAKTGEVTDAVYEHPFIVRFCHWVNTVALFVLVGSGLQIFRAFPSFRAKIPQRILLNWPKAYALGGWLGGGVAMAPDLHVDLHRHRHALRRLRNVQRELSADIFLCPATFAACGRWRATIFSSAPKPPVD